MLLTDLLVQAANTWPNKPALVAADSTSVSFISLNHLSNQIASRLRKLGITRNSRVALLHENGLMSVAAFWGILKSGAKVVNVPYLSGPDVIGAILGEAKPHAIFSSEYHLGRLIKARVEAIPQLVVTMDITSGTQTTRNIALQEITVTEPTDEIHSGADSSDVAVIVYTSGTTGKPKGVMLSHNNLLSNIKSVNELMGLTSDDSILVVVPLHFIHGIMQLLTHALVGGTLVYSDGFQFPQKVLESIRTHSVTGFSGVPYHYLMLLDRTQLATTALPNLRYVVITGGALSPTALRRLSQALPNVAIHIGYGQTEASPRICNLEPHAVLSRPDSVGVPIPGVNVQILDGNGEELPRDLVGEVVVSGPNVMCGYVSGDETTSGKVDRLGRLHTGDLGWKDGEGYLYLCGRCSDLIKTAGERVFPSEIESVLQTHDAVREVAVFGVADTMLGERIVASAVLHSGKQTTPEELRTHCLKSLPLVRVPREIRFVDSLPKTGSGKIERSKLAAQFESAAFKARVESAA